MTEISLEEARAMRAKQRRYGNGAIHGAEAHSTLEPDLSVLREGRSAPPTLPLELMGPWATWIQNSACAANAPSDYVLAALLAGAAAAIGNARKAEAWPGWVEPCVLWFAAVGVPSSGKSPAADAVMSALRAIQQEELREFESTRLHHETSVASAKAALSVWEDEVKAAKKSGGDVPLKPEGASVPEAPPAPQILVQDATIEAVAMILHGNPRGCLVARDELSGWLASMGRYSGDGERQFWLECYGGRSYRVDRKNGKCFSIPHLSSSIYGGIQPDIFSTMALEAGDDGLVARMLWVWPMQMPFERPSVIPDLDMITDAFRRLRSLPMANGEHGPCPSLVTCTDEAAGILEDWCRQKSRVEHMAGSLHSSWAGKCRGHALRLSLVLEYLEWAPSPSLPEPAGISAMSVMRATELYDRYFAPMALRAFGDAGLPQEERDATTLARYIRKEGLSVIHPREVYKAGVGGIRSADRALKAARILQQAGWLLDDDVCEEHQRSVGRPVRQFYVNPKLWPKLEEVSHAS